uniref:Uncharacterized protein n=1 Tax=Setaria italica TaxID=4555 RepID=K3Z2F5_SETIT
MFLTSSFSETQGLTWGDELNFQGSTTTNEIPAFSNLFLAVCCNTQDQVIHLSVKLFH